MVMAMVMAMVMVMVMVRVRVRVRDEASGEHPKREFSGRCNSGLD